LQTSSCFRFSSASELRSTAISSCLGAPGDNFLQSSLSRAVIFSALTTASGFGTLWLSKHPGTASMGELLTISLAWTLVTTLFFLPALLQSARAR